MMWSGISFVPLLLPKRWRRLCRYLTRRLAAMRASRGRKQWATTQDSGNLCRREPRSPRKMDDAR